MTEESPPTGARPHPALNLIEVEPHRLNADERQTLRQAILTKPSNEDFTEFVAMLELELGKYLIRRRLQRQKTITPSQARKACRDIGKTARQLRAAWNKAPMEALQLLDLAYQEHCNREESSEEGQPPRYVWTVGSAFSHVSTPFFQSLEQSLEPLIATCDLAATGSEKKKRGGRPLNAPLIFLLRGIAQGFVAILDEPPTTTPTGPFAETVHWALDLVSDNEKVKSVPKHIERAVKEIKQA